MADQRRSTGKSGEDAAVAHLEANGYRMLERNARTRYGELDIVALDGATLVFVEVKALRGAGLDRAERALESIGPRKQLQVRRLARAFLAERQGLPRSAAIRFDAVGVALGARGSELVHVPAAF